VNLINCARILLPLIFFAVASPARAEAWHYFRADGRLTTLDVSLENQRAEIRVPASRHPVRLGRNVIVRTGTDTPQFDDFREYGLRTVRPLAGLARTWILGAENPRSAVQACARLYESGRVVWAVPDFIVPVSLCYLPDDPLYPAQWHLANADQQDIATEAAWDITRGISDVVVAVLDTGVDPGHPDLDASAMVNPKNILNGSDDPSPTQLAIDAHGTACTGLVAAIGDNGTGTIGVCPLCSWMPVRIFGDFAQMASLSQIAEGITYAADNGAWVISNSWGIGQELIDQGGLDMTVLYEAVHHAVNSGREAKGCVVLFAAGNGDGDLNAQPIGPDELPAMEETIAVGGCDHEGTAARYSDYGECVTVIAPTWSGWDGDPKIVSIDNPGNAGYNKGGEFYKSEPGQGDVPTGEAEPDEDGDYTQHFTGTSAATPIVAGVAALVLAANPELGWQDVRDILQSTADKVGGVDYLDGHNLRYGYGRVNAHRAVAVARYGRDNPDGAQCALDINCLGVCRTSPPGGGDPLCATPCSLDTDCGIDLVCLEGFCDEKEPDPEIVVEGGCGCGQVAGGWRALWLLLIPLSFIRRPSSPRGLRR